jgi:tetratricopeptide (TPR) repeat protein
LFGEAPPADEAAEAPETADSPEAIEELLAAAAEAEVAKPERHAPRKRPQAEERHFELSANAIDLESILGDFESPPPTAHAASEDVEVDLSIAFDDVKPDETSLATADQEADETDDLEGVFGNLREQSARRSGLDEAEKEYKRGLALRQAGDIDGCIKALEQASRAPRLRFATAWMIGRLYRDRDMMPEALEWLERAAQAPAPTSDDQHQLLYELADGLEKTGEMARALAISLELEADAGEYRDIRARIDRLTKVQTGG